MKIDWNEKPDGSDMMELRDFMKRAVSNSDIQLTDMEGIIFFERRRALRSQNHIRQADVPAIEQKVEKNCRQYIETLQKLGYVETQTDSQKRVYYIQTIAGLAFAMASPKRFTRKAAQKQLDEFLRRCKELNGQEPDIDSPETICQVDEVIVYGSFAVDGTTDVGDVDLCVTWSVRDNDLYRKYNSRSFKKFGISEALNRAPEFLVMKKLRKGLNILSVGSQLPDGVEGTVLLKRVEVVS